MNDRSRLWIAGSSTLLLAACASQPGNSAVEGAAIGGIAGYALCKMAGHSDRDCQRFAVVTGGITAAVMYNYASNLEKRRKELAGRENNLDARIAYVKGLNEDGQKLNEDLRTRVLAADKRTGELLAQVQQNRASAKSLQAARSQLSKDVDAAQQQARSQQEAYDEVRRYRAGLRQPSRALDTEVARQEQIVAETQGHVNQLLSLRERIPVG